MRLPEALTTMIACVALVGCSQAQSPSATSTGSARPSRSATPTPSRAVGLADARAAAYGMYSAIYDIANVGSFDQPDTVCGSVSLGNDQGWFTLASQRDVMDPDARASRITGWAAWALKDTEIEAADAALDQAATCAADDVGWAEHGASEPLASPFAGSGARLTSTKDDRQRLRIYGRVGNLLIQC